MLVDASKTAMLGVFKQRHRVAKDIDYSCGRARKTKQCVVLMLKERQWDLEGSGG